MTIEIQSISKRYPEVVALETVTTSIASGEVVALLGPNGAGKTTLLRIMATLTHPTSGMVTWNGVCIRRNKSAYLQKVGTLFGDPFVYDDLTVEENLELFAGLYGVKGAISFDRWRLGELRRRQVKHLSRGQRQRVGLLRSVIHHPDIVIWDEPFVGLDSASIQVALDEIQSIKGRGGIACVATHTPELLDGIATVTMRLEKGALTSTERAG